MTVGRKVHENVCFFHFIYQEDGEITLKYLLNEHMVDADTMDTSVTKFTVWYMRQLKQLDGVLIEKIPIFDRKVFAEVSTKGREKNALFELLQQLGSL